MRKRLLILGTRTFAEEIADLASDVPGFEVVGFVENMDPARCERDLGGLPVHWVDGLAALAKDHWVLCGLGTTFRSRFTDQADSHGVPFATLVHPTARVSRTSTLGPGTIVSAGAVIASHTTLGRHVVVNRGATIGHHTSVGDFVTIGPGATIGGNSRVGPAVYVGMGASILDHLVVGGRSVVGAGAVVTKEVPDRVQVVGVPARIVKTGIDGK